MQLLIESSVIQEALRVCQRLAPSQEGVVSIISDGSSASMFSASTVDRCSYKMPCKVKGKASIFAISVEALRDATKGRKDLDIMYANNLLNIKSGSYATKLATVDALQNEYDEEKKSNKIKVSAEQAVWLKSAVAAVALKPTTILSTFMPLTIQLGAKGAFISCYDNQHMAFLSSKEIEGEMDVTLPLNTLQSVLDTFNDSKFVMQLSQSNLYVSNSLIDVVLAMQQVDENALTGKDVRDKSKEASKMEGNEIIVARKDLNEFLANAKAVMTKERGEVSIQTEKGKMKLVARTVNGSTKVTIPAQVKKTMSVDIDYEYFEEAIGKCHDEVSMRVVGEDFILFKQKVATVLVALNQPAAPDTEGDEEKPKKKKKSKEED